MCTQLPTILLATALACSLFAAPAQAAAARTFVSAAGSDSNNCTNVATPCRHLAAAYAATAANGEIYVLDPANYGSLTITHGVSIEGHGWASIAPVAGQAAITINANSGDRINIIGVVLDGTAVTGSTGIQFNSGNSLTVRDSVIRNFSGDGIDFEPSAGGDLWVSNTLVSDNGNTGIAVFPTDNSQHQVTINRVEISNNPVYGVFLWGTPGNGNILATVSESVVSGSQYGFYALTEIGQHSGVLLSLFHSIVTKCRFIGIGAGIAADGSGASIAAANSMSTANDRAFEAVNGGVVQSYGDNYFGNNSAVFGAPPSLISRE